MIEQAIGEMLHVSLPARLRGVVTAENVKGSILEHIERYDEEKARFPNEMMLPWTNWIGYDDDWDEAFFVAFVLEEAALELFCGTGFWPDVRHFGEGKALDIPPANWHREWSLRFTVPCPPLVLGKAAVKGLIGRDW